jgi:hypothetical protein
MKPDLRLDWVDHKAAKYAVEHWHYSRSLPTPPLVRVGVWEGGKYIGVVLFSRGANNNLGKPYGCDTTEVCELTRVALSQHQTPVSRIVALAIKFLKRNSPKLRIIVSFADPNQGHHGGIYQAGGWTYVGQTPPSHKYIDRNGREWHQRQVSVSGVKPQYGEMRRVAKISECKKVPQLGKYRYLMPLDKAMRAQIAPLAKPYPKRRAEGVDSDTPGIQPGEGGAVPTSALHETPRVQT